MKLRLTICGQPPPTFTVHDKMITSIAFTPDDSQMISTSADGTLILWDVATGERLRTFNEQSAPVSKVVLSPDGKTAYSAAEDGNVIARPIATRPVDAILVHVAEKRYLHDFTCVERNQYRIFPLCDADGRMPQGDN